MVSPERNVLSLLEEVEKRDKIIKSKNEIIKNYESTVNSYKQLINNLNKSVDEKINIITSLAENGDSQYQTALSLVKKIKELQETINNITKLKLN